MYAAHFGLTERPFSLAPDPRYLYLSDAHREALAHLLYGVGGGGSIVQLTGEVGTGKTTVCRTRSEEHTSELQSHSDLVCRLLLEKKKKGGRTRHIARLAAGEHRVA